MSLTSQLSDNLLNHVFRNEPYTSPSTVYVGLFTSSGEVNGSGYERQAITFGAPSNNEIANTNEVRFPIALAEWGNIESAGVFDAKTGGNRLDDASISTARLVRENDQFVIPEGNYTISLG